MDLFETVTRRRSIRKFKPEMIPSEDLKKILEAGRLAPSGNNRQPWRFVIVRDADKKKQLSEASGQKFIADAAVVIVALGDTSAYEKVQGKLWFLSKKVLPRIPYIQDPMIAVEHMVLASTALGYGSCWIGAFRHDQVRKMLRIPNALAIIALVPVGFPDENTNNQPRRRFNELFFEDSYGNPLKV